MVHLTTRFAVLAVAIAALHSVDVAARPAGHSKSGVASKSASQQDAPAPILPLPLRMQHGSKALRKGDTQEKAKGGKGNDEETHKGGKKHKERQQDDDNAPSLKQAFFHRFSRPHPRHEYDEKVVMNGDHEHLRISDHDRHGHHGHHWDDDKVIMNGDHEHVRIKDRRSPSSVLVHNNHGQSFLVSRTHRAITRRNAATLGKRVDGDAPCGTIDLMLQNDAGQPKKVGYLYLDTSKNPAEVDASESNSTLMRVVPDNTYMAKDMNTASQDPGDMFVQVQVDVTDTSTLTKKTVCLTYNSSPEDPAPMTAAKCRNSTEPADKYSSQIFQYNPESRAISPMGASSTASAQDVAAAEDMMERGTSLQARDTAQTQNVTLVFNPNGAQEDSAHAQAEEDAVYTTVTETVTATVTAPSNSRSAPAQDMDSSSSLFTTASASSTLTVSSSSSTPSINPLKVEVFSASSSDVASSSSATGFSSAISSTSASAMSSSVNAEAVASGIANPSSSETDPSPASSSTATSTSLSSTISIAARAEMTAVSTAPYNWQFTQEA